MAYEFITYRVDDRIAYVTLNRPQVMNALHAEANAEVLDAFTSFRDDDAAWIAILTGAGDRAFSAGNDLRATAERTARGEKRVAGVGIPFGGITAGFECAKPVIAAVNGYALGGGFELAMACDVIVAADTAQFGLPEPRVGLVAGAGGMHRLPMHLPLKVAMGMMLTGGRITAAEGAALGLVNEVVPQAALAGAALGWARQMLECSPVSLRVTKQCPLAGLALPVEAAMAADRDSGLLAGLYDSADYREGPAAFAEKRTPQWTGR
jgi:enoyl-CoA hydratase/carnithine racemase